MIKKYFKKLYYKTYNFFANIKEGIKYFKIGFKNYNFDYEYLLELELFKLKEMKDYFQDGKLIANYSEIVRDIKLAISLIEIIIGKKDDELIKCIENNEWKPSDNSTIIDEALNKYKYIFLKNINLNNIDKFISNKENARWFKKMLKEKNFMTASLKEEMYKRKAWYLYCKLRFDKMQSWWD